MTALVVRGDAAHLPLPDASVDLVVTSPPYFALRSYTDGGEHYSGQVGSEPTPAEYIAALIACTREWVRVLKPSGSIWVNLGDKYSQRVALRRSSHQDGLFPGRPELEKDWKRDRAAGLARMPNQNVTDAASGAYVPEKSLMLLPERYRIACVDELGLIARAVVIWSKCLSGGTQVYARTKGRPQSIRLHDLCRAYLPEDVQLWTGERWSQVRAWESAPRGEAQYEIELRSGERIGCTPEHRWPTRRGLLCTDEIQVGDVLDTCTLPEGETAPAALDDEMIGWFVGLYIAEGSRSEQTIQFAGHVREIERFKRLSEIAAAFHGTARVYATGGNTATINLTGAMLRAILETYVGGRTAKDKHLAPKCWQRSNRFLRAVLDGYLSGDGHWREDARRWIVRFTDNDALAADLRTLGARLGLSVRLNRCTHTGFGKEWPGWLGNIIEPTRRRQPDSEVVAIRPSRARQFWDVAIEDEPHLFALASGVLTHNSNGLPESVTDRVRRSHEDWVHLTVRPRYYAAVDRIRQPHLAKPQRRLTPHENRAKGNTDRGGGWSGLLRDTPTQDGHPLGALPGSVWTIPTQPLTVPPELGVDHFAAFPMEWPRRIIAGWSPEQVCTACGEGRRPVVVKDPAYLAARAAAQTERERKGYAVGAGYKHGRQSTSGVMSDLSNGKIRENAVITGEQCACPDTSAPTTPGVVLDPFGGTGTTTLVASVMGRTGISVDMSGDYCRLARWRTTDPGQRAAAMQVEKPARQVVDQLDLFGEGAA